MAPLLLDEIHEFRAQPSSERRRSVTGHTLQDSWAGLSFCDFFVGASARRIDEGRVEIGLSIHDGTYSIDFAVHQIRPGPGETIASALKEAARINVIRFSEKHQGKFVAAGITAALVKLCPDIASFLWSELDMLVLEMDVAVVQKFPLGTDHSDGRDTEEALEVGVDEQADSAIRKALLFFGPQKMPVLSIGFRNKVEVDTGGLIQLVHGPENYKKLVSEGTWKCALHFAEAMKRKNVKIAFFSATPQGGGVALMRHSLIRFLTLMGVKAEWYIPKPNPSVFRITKTNHNILQDVANSEARFTPEKQEKVTNWIVHNAERYWLPKGGPLSPGGADVVVVDDPQMPGLIPLIKQARPEVKIIYRSHIEINSELVSRAGSPQEEVWKYSWDRIKLADLFISHPVNRFVPSDVPSETVALMPATTDWLDGLNKPMREWDLRYYHHALRLACQDRGTNKLDYPAREYICQIARFDPSKGIDVVIKSYLTLRKLYDEKLPGNSFPQLLICGHSAIDDPDGSIIFDQVIGQLDQPEYEDVRDDVVVIRLGPSDQVLNALISTAKIVLQLSSREGFEVKVSEALHKGKPVIATRAGGIPLQVQHGRNGFLVDIGDYEAVAEYAFDLLNDEKKWRRMSGYAQDSVSDEVSTVGNAVCWMHLAERLASGEKFEPCEQWIADLAHEAAGVEWKAGETRLPRDGLKVTVKDENQDGAADGQKDETCGNTGF